MKYKVCTYSKKIAKENKIYVSLFRYLLTYFLTFLFSFLLFLLFNYLIKLVHLSDNVYISLNGIMMFIIILFDFFYILFPISLKFNSRLKAFCIFEDELYIISINDLILILFETTLFLPKVNENDKDNNFLKKIKYYLVGILTSFFVFSKIRKNMNKMQDKEAIIKFVKNPLFYKRSANVYKVQSVYSIKYYKDRVIINYSSMYLTKNKEYKDNTLVIYNTYENFSDIVNLVEKIEAKNI